MGMYFLLYGLREPNFFESPSSKSSGVEYYNLEVIIYAVRGGKPRSIRSLLMNKLNLVSLLVLGS